MKHLVATLVLLTALCTPVAATASGCPSVVDAQTFADAATLRRLTGVMAGFGARSTASPAHQRMISWLDRELRRMPDVEVSSEPFRIHRWQSLGAGLTLDGRKIAVAGPIPYTQPGFRSGPLVYLPSGVEITPANALGKVVLRDFPPVDRGYLAEPALTRDLTAAGLAGAAGLIVAFPFPLSQVRNYWDPHTGTHHWVPGVFVGSAEAEVLKASSGHASIGVLGWRSPALTRSLIATLPGRSSERIVLDTNTDGTTWVQDNGNAALLALATYFSHLPLRCRPRTLEFVFATGHLHRSAEGSEFRARALDADYSSGTVAFAFVLEHLGTRELVPVDGSLRYTDLSELSAWFAGSPTLASVAGQALARRGVDRTFVLSGVDPPDHGRAPPQCSFGGIGTHFHGHLIPTMAMISGPWSLWAPSFGSSAVDFSRMHQQTLAAGDAVLALGDVPRESIAGPYLDHRTARANGAPTCSHDLPPEFAPR